MSELADLVEDSLETLPGLLDRFNPAADRDTLVRKVDTVCQHFQVLAAGALLLEGSARFFFQNLAQSAENWRRLLVWLARQGWTPPPATWNVPLLDAVVAEQWTLAVDVARHSARQWQRGEEYEDDFAWAAVLRELVLPDSSGRASLTERLDRLEAVGAETQGPKLAMAKALLAGDGRGFHSAFEAAHSAYEEVTERHARMGTLPRRGFLPHRYLWMEGLALLRLAERAGLPPPGSYLRYCPRLALGKAAVELQPAWRVPLA
ncbi:Imm49 family immunity protein [Myxococcus sp. RHSTA-1-4]|uniref:Imm49 family immunity protein n=1 Tax=Myxococcus sp. RHSTA-1-4 TaxID=2874601 RepID=UPI001CBD71E6|nr:Imm49 family immunity protein [Myxococcus sp. RHSTA-1-4]MBZ4422602.1 immunity 49 family protein [Myxococcus sp. RHSTA-1-4]